MSGSKRVILSPHAEEKLKRLKMTGVTKEKIMATVRNPAIVSSGYLDRKIAQSPLSDDLLLRVVYEETDKSILVVTIYPAKRRRYE